MNGQEKIIALAAKYDAAVDAVKREELPTNADVDKFVIDLANIVRGLIEVVAEHVAQPFTKAHAKGRDE